MFTVSVFTVSVFTVSMFTVYTEEQKAAWTMAFVLKSKENLRAFGLFDDRYCMC